MIYNSGEDKLLKFAYNLKLIPIVDVFPIVNTGTEVLEKRSGILPRQEESGLTGRFLGLFFSTCVL